MRPVSSPMSLMSPAIYEYWVLGAVYWLLVFGISPFAFSQCCLHCGGLHCKRISPQKPPHWPILDSVMMFPLRSRSTFLYFPSEAVVELRTLFVARDLSDVRLVNEEGCGGNEGSKGNVEGAGGSEDDSGDEDRDDGGSGGGGGGGYCCWGGGGIGGSDRRPRHPAFGGSATAFSTALKTDKYEMRRC